MSKLKEYDYDFFFEQYFTLNKSTNDIARELNVSGCSVVRKMRKLGIELGNVRVKCSVCGKELIRKKSQVFGKRKLSHFYCSKKCESIDKSIMFSGESNPFYGMKHNERTKKIISKTNSNKKMPLSVRAKISRKLSGKNSPNWKNGASERNKKDRLKLEYRNWRTIVFERDDYTCRKCHVRGGYLHVHHLKNYSDHEALRIIPTNGITLCKECHNEFHEIYSRKNNTVQQILEFLGGDDSLGHHRGFRNTKPKRLREKFNKVI